MWFEIVDYPPTADQVATAIVAACRETGADPITVASGNSDDRRATVAHKYAISRARVYAALAIRAVFEENGPAAIARWVGAGTPSCYVTNVDRDLKEARLKWWDEAAFKRVIAATEESV